MSRTALTVILSTLVAAACSQPPRTEVCPDANLFYNQDAELTMWLRTNGKGVSTAAVRQCPDIYMHIYLSDVPPQHRREFWEAIRDSISNGDSSEVMNDFLVEGRGRIVPEEANYGVPRIILSQVRLVGPTAFPDAADRVLSPPNG
jgi:hypothetical protein